MAKDEPATTGKPRPPADPERRIAFRFGLSAESRSAAVHFHRRPQVSTEVRSQPKKPPLHSHNIRSYKPRSFL
jgi:hypothetical protein